MAILNILEFPDKRLRTEASEVDIFDEFLRQLVADMFETMYEAPGIGLAASQVNVHKQILVADVSEEKNQPLCLVNPVITASDGHQVHEEGCLSVPGIYAEVERANNIELTAQDEFGKPLQLSLDGMQAVCIQHEMDHLKGVLFVDYLSPMKRERVRKKLQKQKRQAL